MTELIKIENRAGIETVNARELQQALDSKQDFSTWIKSRLEGFVEGQDYLVHKIMDNPLGGRPTIDYHLTIDTAKHLAMLERNDKGRAVRAYFIEVEKQTRKAIPKTYAEALRLAADQAELLIAQAPKVEAYEILMKTETTMSITEASKHFGLHPKLQVFPFLRDRGYLTSKDLPTQKAIDADILTLRQNDNINQGKTYPQAVVEARQLDNFRKLIAQRIAEQFALLA